MKYEDLKIGQKFEWCGLKLVKLKDNLCIIYDLENIKGKFCIFDTYNNNYEESMIREYINGKFLKLNNIDKSCLLKIDDTDDYATLLSRDEFEKNKMILRGIKQDYYYWWLRSPYAVNSNFAYYVYYSGYIDNSVVCSTHAVRAAFILKSDTTVSLIQ